LRLEDLDLYLGAAMRVDIHSSFDGALEFWVLPARLRRKRKGTVADTYQAPERMGVSQMHLSA